jgi:membrane fusion protein, multidrug efflux system
MNGRVLTRSFLAGAIAIAAIGCAEKTKKTAEETVPVTTAAVLQRDMPMQLRAIGTVEPVRTVAVRAQVTGELTRVHFREGQDVRNGDLLFEIDPRSYQAALAQAEAALARDTAQAKNADSEVARYAQLVEKDYVTPEAYDKNVAAAEAARAVVAADRATVENARLQLSYCTIRSPLDGRTGSVMVHAGNLVKANDATLVSINQITPVYATFSVPEEYLPQIKSNDGQTVEAISPSTSEKLGSGRVSFVDNAVNESTGTITLKASFPNADRRLWPGEFVNVNITLGASRNAIVVPSRAIQTGQRGQFVYVVRKDRSVENRPVKVVRTVGEESIIGSGLAAGEEVVTDGQLRLTPKSRVAVRGAVVDQGAGS